MNINRHLWTYIAVVNPEVPAISVKLWIKESEIRLGNIKLGCDGIAAVGTGNLVPEPTLCIRGCHGVSWNRSNAVG